MPCFEQHTPEDVVAHQIAESREVWRGVRAIIEEEYSWDSFIVEGVAILPDLVAALNDKAIHAAFLIDDDSARIRKRIVKRGLWDDAEAYDDALKEHEVAWVAKYNRWVRREAKRYGFPRIPAERATPERAIRILHGKGEA